MSWIIGIVLVVMCAISFMIIYGIIVMLKHRNDDKDIIFMNKDEKFLEKIFKEEGK